MLEEMDEEFGVGSLITETLQEEKQQVCVCVHLCVSVYVFMYVDLSIS